MMWLLLIITTDNSLLRPMKPLKSEMWSWQHAATATVDVFSRQSGCTQVNAITCLHGNPDDLSWEMEACLMGFLAVFVQWFGKIQSGENKETKQKKNKNRETSQTNILQQSEVAAEANYSRQNHKRQDAADLVWLRLMIVTSNASFRKLHPPSLLICFAVHRSSGWSVRAPAGLPSLLVSASSASAPSWLSAPSAAEGPACTAAWWLAVNTSFSSLWGNIQRCRWVCDSEKPSSVECTLTLELPSEKRPHVSVHFTTGNPATVLAFY